MFLIILIMQVFYLKISSSLTFINVGMATVHNFFFYCFVFLVESVFSFLEVTDIIVF